MRFIQELLWVHILIEKDKEYPHGDTYRETLVSNSVSLAMSYADALGVSFSDDKERLDVEENLRQILKILEDKGFLAGGSVEWRGTTIDALTSTPKLLDTFRYSYEYGLLTKIASGEIDGYNKTQVEEFLRDYRYQKIGLAYIPVALSQKDLAGEIYMKNLSSGMGTPPPLIMIHAGEGARITSIAVVDPASGENIQMDTVFTTAVDLVSSYLLDQISRSPDYHSLKHYFASRSMELTRYIREGNIIAIATVLDYLNKMLIHNMLGRR